MAQHDDWWTIEDIANHLDVPAAQVWALVGRGALPQPDAAAPMWRPSTIQAHDPAQVLASNRPEPDDEWWGIAEFAAYLERSPSMLYSYRSQGRLPEEDKTEGGRPKWRPRTAIAWNEQGRPPRGRPPKNAPDADD